MLKKKLAEARGERIIRAPENLSKAQRFKIFMLALIWSISDSLTEAREYRIESSK